MVTKLEYGCAGRQANLTYNRRRLSPRHRCCSPLAGKRRWLLPNHQLKSVDTPLLNPQPRPRHSVGCQSLN